jgi:hypothetical protein
MNNQYDKELIIDVIEAIETLGIDGFHWGYNDKELPNSREELKMALDKIIICLEHIDKEFTPDQYIKAKGERASELKGLIDFKEDMDIPLGCVIAAIIYNRDRFEYLRLAGWKDIIFYAPLYIIKKLQLKK